MFALLTLAMLLAACGNGGSADTGAREAKNGLSYRGLAYDTGTAYGPGPLSREVWNKQLLEGELDAISDQLHANSVTIFGTDIERLVESATAALERDLHVWLQPRLIDRPQAEVLRHLAHTAQAAERLRRQFGDVSLNVGVESSLFVPGIVAGATWWDRISTLSSGAVDVRAMWRRMNAFLARAAAVARAHFHGEITYSAGPWESKAVDWRLFDFVGLDYYAYHPRRAGHVAELRAFRRWTKPIIITEFGTNAFEGAPKLEGGGWAIVDYSKPVPEISGKHIRSEQVQADYLVEMLDLFESQGIYGAYVYTFIQPDLPYSPNPRYDLDLASFGLVKAIRDNPQNPASPYRWEPKRAFHVLAERYGAAS